MGSAILIKSILQGGLSLMVFGWSHIVMDIQSLTVLVSGVGHLHGFLHTYTTLLAIFSVLTSKYRLKLSLKVLKLGFFFTKKILENFLSQCVYWLLQSCHH
jgi:hypothetical protein